MHTTNIERNLEDEVMKRRLCYFIVAVLMVCVAFALTACGSETEEPQQEAEATTEAAEETTQNDGGSLYKEIVNGDILVEYPEGWKTEVSTGKIVMSKDGSENPPFITVEEMGWVEYPDNYVASQMDAFKEKYGNQMAKPPQSDTMKVAGMELKGFIAKYSMEDGSGTVTRQEYLEEVDGLAYHFVCEYVSSASGDQHEDETTYFDFMHAIESMKIKTE